MGSTKAEAGDHRADRFDALHVLGIARFVRGRDDALRAVATSARPGDARHAHSIQCRAASSSCARISASLLCAARRAMGLAECAACVHTGAAAGRGGVV
ncbi:hypothetical protein [Burkholderia sp. BDU5]|uniref:Uncharacterized protein n=1 Tax=Burkholderia mayonis TaxID=1385591 RepID=A0A1B4FPE7_9BURK|nr:hypothetical protein [Burkholderia sp. BDU5]AOJ05554.1 hypothetical protein WS70_28225 [Burkholderia mayonis]KVE34730.1 hypothetical protein WS69_16315 [Burkholderia sp. BDU5]KVE47730.1 hypothetical protein WS70_24535 [Burkholderia mayonis]